MKHKYSAEFKKMCQPWRKEAHGEGWRVTNDVVFFDYLIEFNADEHLRQLQANPNLDARGFPKDDSD